MAFLGFVVTPATPLSYPVFNAAASAVGTAGAIFNAAKAAAIAAIVGQGALVAGAGFAGFALGQQILRSLEYTGVEPTVRQLYKAPAGSGNLRVFAISKFVNQPEINYENVFPSPVVIPVSFETQGSVRQGALVGPNATFVPYLQAGRDLIERGLEVTSITAENGSPVPNLLKLPQYAPVFPVEPFKLPALVPVTPGIPDFPITPTVVPNPDNEPDQGDEKAKTPGVIVQIPETGQQFIFTPGGVVVQRYRSPKTEPFEAPKVPPPPGTQPPATQECPCPEGENKDDEIICRIKTLQKEILDDGFLESLQTFGGAQSFEVLNLSEGFYKVETNATVVPKNAKRISYPAPGKDTVFVGNLQWIISGVVTEPVPIRGERQIMLAPEGARGYVVSGAFGFQINSIAYSRTKKDFIDLC
jgi:hypothetical protein